MAAGTWLARSRVQGRTAVWKPIAGRRVRNSTAATQGLLRASAHSPAARTHYGAVWESDDWPRGQRIGSGGFSALPADMAHYAFVDEETVIQISTTGPWSITYLNPADDPRNKAK